MRPINLALLALSLAAVVVVGQVPTNQPTYEKPVDHQWDESQCHRLMVENLYRATNPNDPLQQQYLWAAEAYQKLVEAHQSCE